VLSARRATVTETHAVARARSGGTGKLVAKQLDMPSTLISPAAVFGDV
jgi:hypothetical protein